MMTSAGNFSPVGCDAVPIWVDIIIWYVLYVYNCHHTPVNRCTCIVTEDGLSMHCYLVAKLT